MNQAFYGCTNLTIAATDAPDLTSNSCNSMASTFRGCTSLTDIANIATWDTSGIASYQACFLNAGITGAFPLIDTSGATVVTSAFRGLTGVTSWPSFDFSSVITAQRTFKDSTGASEIPAFSMPALTDATLFGDGVTWSTTSYSGLLVSLDASNSNSVIFDGGNSQYNAGGATARAALIADHSWTITDGGAA
jgi:hypothetical protein